MTVKGDVFVEGKVVVAVEEGWGGVGACEVAYAGADWSGFIFCWVEIWKGEDAGEIAGVGAEVKDLGEVTVDILQTRSDGEMETLPDLRGIHIRASARPVWWQPHLSYNRPVYSPPHSEQHAPSEGTWCGS